LFTDGPYTQDSKRRVNVTKYGMSVISAGSGVSFSACGFCFNVFVVMGSAAPRLTAILRMWL